MGHIVVTDETVTVYGFDNMEKLDLHIGKRGLVLDSVKFAAPVRVCDAEPCTCPIRSADPAHWAPGPEAALIGRVDTSRWAPVAATQPVLAEEESDRD